MTMSLKSDLQVIFAKRFAQRPIKDVSRTRLTKKLAPHLFRSIVSTSMLLPVLGLHLITLVVSLPAVFFGRHSINIIFSK